MSNVVGTNNPGNAPQDPLHALTKPGLEKVDYTEPEQSLWRGGYSPKAMFGTWLFSIVITIGIIVGSYFLRDQVPYIWYICGGVILAWWLCVLLVYAYRRLGYSYELTSLRFVHQKGILIRRTDRIDVIEIDDVMFTQGIVERMLGVGSIKLTSSDKSHPELWLRGIDKVQDISNLIDNARLKLRQRRSIVAV